MTHLKRMTGYIAAGGGVFAYPGVQAAAEFRDIMVKIGRMPGVDQRTLDRCRGLILRQAVASGATAPAWADRVYAAIASGMDPTQAVEAVLGKLDHAGRRRRTGDETP